MGVAQAMIGECERFCLEDLKKNEMYIRVEASNLAALRMYTKLGYKSIINPEDSIGNISILRKKLVRGTVSEEAVKNVLDSQQHASMRQNASEPRFELSGSSWIAPQ
jgi:ribosomal protein S18 acetylase RimI-like enzyme